MPPMIEPLSERHDRAAFSSDVEPLDRYLRMQARQDVLRRVAACFVLTLDDDPSPVGYYTLAATSAALVELPGVLAKRLPRYPNIPAALLGRLAVDVRYRGRGFGELLLFDAFRRTLSSDIATYAIVVDPKDEPARRFYGRYRFLPLSQSGGRFFLPMAEVARLFA